jgi:hypothetical protein
MTDTPNNAGQGADVWILTLGSPTEYVGGASAGPRPTLIILEWRDATTQIYRPDHLPAAQAPRRSLPRRLLRLAWRLLPTALFVILHRDVIVHQSEHLLRSIGL